MKPNAGTVIGFGFSFSKSKDTVCVMQEVNVKIFTKAQCTHSLNSKYFNRKDTLCAGIMEGGSDACQVSKNTKLFFFLIIIISL